MTLFAFTTYDGIDVDGGADVLMTLPFSQSGEAGFRPSLRSRFGRAPVFDGAEFGEATGTVWVQRASSSALTSEQFDAYARALFRQRNGLVAIGATAEGVTLQNVGIVQGFKRLPSRNAYTGTLLLPDPVWRSTTTQTDSATPLSNTGRVRALPTITITPTTSTVKRRRVTVTDNTTRGLANYPILASYDSTTVSATTTSDYITFFRGRAIPQRVNSPNTNPSKHWFRMDVPPGGSDFADIYYGSSVANAALADVLEYAGVNIEGATVSNTVIEWNDYRCSLFPKGVPWAWVPIRFGTIVSGESFGITSEGASSSKTGYTNTLTFTVAADDSLANDANALLLTLGTEAGTTDALTNFYAQLTVTTGSPRARLLYRVAGSAVWQEKESRNTTGALTATRDIDNAVEVVVCLEGLVPGDRGTLAVGVSGSNPQMALTNTPTVSVAAAVTARRLNGVITNTTTGDTITFDDVYMDDEAMTINCLTKRITTATGTPWYSGGEGITFSNENDWFPLAVGSNAWTNTLDATLSIAWEDSSVYSL